MGAGRAEIGMGTRTVSSWQDRWYLSLTGMKSVAPGVCIWRIPPHPTLLGTSQRTSSLLFIVTRACLLFLTIQIQQPRGPGVLLPLSTSCCFWLSSCLPLSCCFWLSSPCLALPCRTLTPRVTWTSRRFLFSFKGFPEKGQSTKRKDQ